MPRSAARAAKVAVCAALNGWLQRPVVDPEKREVPQAWLADLTDEIVAALQPRRTIKRRVWRRIQLAADVPPQADPLDEIMWAPEFPQPMYEPLRDISKDLILPGARHVPVNTVIMLQTNRRFVEAYVVGLNHEMAGELLWRGYPTDQRGSYFRQFWDVRDRIPSAAEAALTDEQRREAFRDVAPLHLWDRNTRLGEHRTEGAATDNVVLILRGTLFQRYPNTLVYAVPAVFKDWKDSDGPLVPALDEYLEHKDNEDPVELRAFLASNPKIEPIFRGDLPADLTFFGFPFPPDLARDYFYIIEERLSEPRFGLDLPSSDDDPVAANTFNDLAWDHFVDDDEAAGAYLNALAPVLPDESELDVGLWTEDGEPTSADIAKATMQAPVRIAIPGTELLPDNE